VYGPDTSILLAQSLRRYVEEVVTAVAGLPVDVLVRVARELLRAREEGATVYIVGNGGSAATASHIASDLAKTVSMDGCPGLRTLALADNTALLTAWANDACYEEVFAAPLRHLVRAGDVLIVVSASGNSPNIVRAVDVAREADVLTIGILGFGGGLVKEKVDICVLVPADDYGPVEDAHLAIGHALTTALRRVVEAEQAEAVLALVPEEAALSSRPSGRAA
jgi:D-sedoheptulose 7-phosphate isomerase